MMTNEQIGRFERKHEIDLAFTIEGIARFRANIYQQRGTIGVVLRIIPLKVYTLEELGMPPVVSDFARCARDLCWSPGRPAAASLPRSPP